MPFELPPPPPDTGFQLDCDPQGRPRLTWPARLTGYGRLKAGCVAAVFCGVLYSLAWDLGYEIDFSPVGTFWERLRAQFAGGRQGFLFFLCFLAVFLLMTAVVLGAILRALLFGRGWKRRALTFGQDALWYQPSLGGADGSPGEEIPRAQVRAVTVVRKRGAERLLVAAGARQWDIGPSLKPRERAWLANVLRAWAVLAGPPPQLDLAPPADSWVRLDHDAAGRPRLHWRPPEDLCRAGRRAMLRRTLAWLAGWALGEALLAGLLTCLLLGDPAALGCFLWLLVPALVLRPARLERRRPGHPCRIGGPGSQAASREFNPGPRPPPPRPRALLRRRRLLGRPAAGDRPRGDQPRRARPRPRRPGSAAPAPRPIGRGERGGRGRSVPAPVRARLAGGRPAPLGQASGGG